jgi:hypothetical protein
MISLSTAKGSLPIVGFEGACASAGNPLPTRPQLQTASTRKPNARAFSLTNPQQQDSGGSPPASSGSCRVVGNSGDSRWGNAPRFAWRVISPQNTGASANFYAIKHCGSSIQPSEPRFDDPYAVAVEAGFSLQYGFVRLLCW